MRKTESPAGWLLLPALVSAVPAAAAGGAHVVDDSDVETPGTCHLESWGTASSHGQWFVNGAPACTPTALPRLEIGGFLSHSWSHGARDGAIGLAPKLAIRSSESGFGIAVDASAGYGLDTHRLETASLIVPLTIPVGAALHLNFDTGWQWVLGAAGRGMFVGAQAEWTVSPALSLMAEGFARESGRAGFQSGLRWTVDGGRIDLDLLGGRWLDGVTPTSLAFGVTVRR